RPDVSETSSLFNRDLSWLKFNQRVLTQASDERNPLLERVRFLGIFTSNLDEFVMKRVGFLMRAMEEGIDPDGDQGYTARTVLRASREMFEGLEQQQAAVFEKSIKPALASEGIELLKYDELAPDERTRLEAWWARNVFPVLTPLAVDEGHRFPFISNLSANLGVLLAQPGSAEPLFARVKVPPALRQWIRVPAADPKQDEADTHAGRGRFVYLPEAMTANLGALFPGLEILEVAPFRVTRAAEWDEEADSSEVPEAETMLEEVTETLKRRRFLPVVRLEVPRDASPRLTRQLTEMLELTPDDVDLMTGLVDFRSLYEIADLPRPDLKNPLWTPVVPLRLRDTRASMFDEIKRGDILVHHPYESFAATTERFIAEAAHDPNVLAIKQTIYRTSRDSPFLKHLVHAAEQGKQVACLVELRARFDESRNVRLAQMLEKAGVHVAYGVIGLKTHCKAALVVRKEPDGLRAYAHLGTGNYNPSTASLYTDLGLFTCDPAITDDAVHLFNLLTGRSLKTAYNRLLVAPATMKQTFIDLIERETAIATDYAAGSGAVGGRIVAKMNALQDPQIIEALYRASRAGVQIDLFVRGFCTLRPGVHGVSENIRVFSVVGRFLEHSRIFYFGSGKPDPMEGAWYIASADWMSRNLDGRVEAACPVLDLTARARLLSILQTMSQDRRNCWRLQPDGEYARLLPAPGVGAESPDVRGTFENLMHAAASV
ncbi:MAG: polyphosphate kinase 1, partial [Phycisphaerales bacterium]|nr:polyphosphate kinase 1 [Phycisphaerales bacterium]